MALVVICVPKHLMCAASPGWWENLHIPSRGTLSPHSAVILTVSDIFSLLCVVPYDVTNKSPSKVILRYSLSLQYLVILQVGTNRFEPIAVKFAT